MRLITAGSRNFLDYARFMSEIDMALTVYPDASIEVVSGCAQGPDSMGIRYAFERQLKVKKFRPDWKLHGRSAGFLRNAEMAEYGTHLIAFWDGQSRGTRHMLKVADKQGLPTLVITV